MNEPGQPTASVKITVASNGPLLVDGPVSIADVNGNVLKEGTRMALCRCGQSGRKPFCDGSHSRTGFVG